MTQNVPKINTFLYTVLYPAHAVTLFGILVYPFIWGIGFKELICLLLGWIFIAGLGSAVTLHRAVSHRAIEFRPWFKPFALWCASLCLQGSPLGWAAIHRGSHHRYSDTDRDAHTPRKGWYYSYHGWLHDWNQYFNPKYVIDLLGDKMHMWIAHNYTKFVLGTYIIVGLIDWRVLLFMFIIPAVYSLHQESLVNLRCHLKAGTRNFETKDDSNNRPIMALLVWGQAWHNNHHAKASSYDFGATVSGKKWELDPSLIFVPFFATTSSRKRIFEARRNAIQNRNS